MTVHFSSSLHDVDVGRDRDLLLVGLAEVPRRAALELLDLLDRLVDLFDRHLQVTRDGLVVVLLEVVEVLVDDRDVEVLGAEDLGLDEQTLAEIARADADRIPLLHDAEDLGRVLGVDAGFFGELLDREVRGARAVRALDALEVEEALVVEVAEDELGEALLVVGEVAHLELPAEVIDERGLLREVLLDGRQLFEAAAARGERLLQRAVLEELLPVDLADLLGVGLLGLAGFQAFPVLEAVDAELALLVGLVDGVDGVVARRPGGAARNPRPPGRGSRRIPCGFPR